MYAIRSYYGKYYQPSDRGSEQQIGQKLDYLANLDSLSQQLRYKTGK